MGRLGDGSLNAYAYAVRRQKKFTECARIIRGKVNVFYTRKSFFLGILHVPPTHEKKRDLTWS